MRRLTRAAERIQAGDFSARVGALAAGEVGTLAAAFDAMVAAVEEKTVALRDAADDEVRLRSRLEAVVAGMSDALVAGDAIPVASTVGPLRVPLGEPGGTVVLLRDLRPEQKIEQMKSELLSRVGPAAG